MRISSIDVGSNAIRQVIIEITPTGQWKVLKKFRVPLRLGKDVFSHGSLTLPTQLEAIEVFKKMAKLEKKYKVNKSICLATSALRDAQNSKLLLQKVRKTSKIKIEIISGKKEAQLIQNAIRKTRIINQTKVLLLDIGGGSAEYTFQQDQKTIYSESFPLGVVRLKQKLETTNKSIKDIAIPFLSRMRKGILGHHFEVMIGTGGNFDALAKLKILLLKKTPHTHLTINELRQIHQKWNRLTQIEKEHLGIRKDRIDVLPLAMQLILISIQEFKIKKIKIPMTGLKEGAIHLVLSVN